MAGLSTIFDYELVYILYTDLAITNLSVSVIQGETFLLSEIF